jgi:hypothetical protein
MPYVEIEIADALQPKVGLSIFADVDTLKGPWAIGLTSTIKTPNAARIPSFRKSHLNPDKVVCRRFA